ncbi:permease [Hydrogenophaga sp.]|uniref:esterase/lipase family protein n=1 Tax=Hydrogenophaga sp. TaxID=1904254 RepID=UPI0025C0344E|nr:permease [Hydrogenophaga sp.]
MAPRSAIWAFAGVGTVFLGYAVILAVEMVAAAMVNREDVAARANAAQWISAWWQEVRVAPLVFAWRQPFCWRQLPDSAETQVSQRAVVLVHGFVCNRGFWLPWMKRLRALNVPYVSLNLEPIFGSIDEYVPLVDAAVARATALSGLPPKLICHSMGGLAARAWLASSTDAAARIDRVITIGTPHRGTWLARFSHLNNGRQMRHDCDWQQDLLSRELLLHAQRNANRFVCWYSNTDNIVFPASTATLPGADNRLVVGAPHVALAFHPRVMDESLAMVASAGSSPSERTAS